MVVGEYRDTGGRYYRPEVHATMIHDGRGGKGPPSDDGARLYVA